MSILRTTVSSLILSAGAAGEMATQTEGTPAEVARKAADAAAKLEASEAVALATKVISADIRSATNTSKGVFHVIRASQDWATAGSAFDVAERKILQKEGCANMSELCRKYSIEKFPYVSIRNLLLAVVETTKQKELVDSLQSLYDFQYESMSKEDQAKNAHESVPENFLNIWSHRYDDRDDESGSTRFNRDRKLAVESAKKLSQLQKMHADARKAEEKKAQERLQESMRNSTATGDTAPAGSGQSPQGIAGATVGGRQQHGRDTTFSVVLQREYGLLTNALYAAADKLPDAVIIPVLTRCIDELVILAAQADEETRARAAEKGPNAGMIEHQNGDKEHVVDVDQGNLEPGDVTITSADLPDVPEDDLDDTDHENMEQVGSAE